MRSLAISLVAMLPLLVNAQEFRSKEYCAQLGDIGANAFRTKQEGHSLESALQKVGYVLADNPQKKQAAQGVVIAIYGDGSIKSASQARSTVLSACNK